MTERLNWGAAIGGVAVALGIAIAAWIMAGSLIEMRRAERVVTVKGLAEREVTADVASWSLPFRGVGDTSKAALAEADRSLNAVRDFAIAGGVDAADVANEPYALRIERRVLNEVGGQVERVRYVVATAVRIRTTNVDAVVELTAKTQELLDAGVLLGAADYSEAAKPQFFYTRLNDIKPGLIEEATKAARASAAQFAKDSGATVGDIASANQGVIQILARDGQYEERFEREKVVRVVSTVRYYLED